MSFNDNLPKLKPCPDCMIHAYVIAGAKDPKEIETYLDFLREPK